MHRDEQIGAGTICNSGALREADENISRAREFGTDAARFQIGFQSRRDLERQVLLHHASGRLRAWIISAMTRIDHHKVTRLTAILIQSESCGRDWLRERSGTWIFRWRKCNSARGRRGRAPRRVVNDDRCGDIWVGAGCGDSQNYFVSVAEPRDRVVG